jgi:signal transduction histidine kinase
MDPLAPGAPATTILLADDEANLRMLVRTTLEHPARRIVEASDGRSALDLARRERPDLVVLDHMMPGMTGLEVLRALRGEPATRPIPIVMLTASGQDKDKLEAERLGVDAYLVKPFSPLELLQAVEQIEGRDAGPDAKAAPADSLCADRRDALLELPAAQLALYARDLKQAVEAEHQRAAELAQANARLRILDRLKTEFLSFISHELRTPLNHMSAVDIFDPDADRGDQLEMIELIRQGYERLEAFVLRGLEYFNWLAVEPWAGEESFDLEALVREVARTAAPEAALELRLAAEARRVRGRSEDAERVLRILLDNARKFSPHAKEVAVRTWSDARGVHVAVRDRGAGFPPELAEEIFRPFTVADGMHHAAGTGLSLALAVAILQIYGGTIAGHSDGPGRGATFTVSLPRADVGEARA